MGDTKPGATFFSLPREIRNEIYRYLVKGCPYFWASPVSYYHVSPATALRDSAIFRVSKAIYHEATSVYFSESTFRYDFSPYIPMKEIIRAPALERMMKIEFEFNCVSSAQRSYSPYGDEIENNLSVTLDKLTGLDSLRNTLVLDFRLLVHHLNDFLSGHLLRRLKALVGFRTVILDVGPMSGPEFWNGQVPDWEGYKGITRAMIEEMVPTMGPATISQVGHITRLKFRPFEHMRANLSGQAEKLQMEMDKLGSEIDKVKELD